MASSNSRGLVLLLITSGFFITGLLFDYMPMIIDDHIKRTIELATNDEILSYWSKPPVDVHSYYWVYDITNAEQFKGNAEKIQVRKVGPFHFTSRMEKRIIEISSNKYRIIYNSSRIMRLNDSYQGFEQFDEQLTLLNPIYSTICEAARASARDVDPQQRAMMSASINRLTEKFNETLFINTTARVALLGRNLPIVQTVKKLAETFGLDAKIPDVLPNGKFGFVAIANDTQTGPFEIYTGYQETAKSLGELISYKGKRRMSYYDGRCNRLQASVGELRPMPLDPTQKLEMYSPNFCRIVHLRPTGLHKLREGMAISYMVSPEDFMSADSNPDNRCYCINGTEDNYCSLNGAIELAPCSYFSPIVLTFSNIQPDQKITGSIQNWDPDLLRSDIDSLPTNEITQVLILKRLGVPVFADITVTLFMKVMRDPSFRQTANVPEISYVPLVTIRETASIPPRLGQVIVNLESFLALTYHIKVIMYLSSVVLLCWLTGYYYCRTSPSDRVVPVRQVRSESRGNAGGGGGQGGQSGGATGGNAANMDKNLAGGSGGNISSSASATGGGPVKRASRQLVDGQRANGQPDESNGQPPSDGDLIGRRDNNQQIHQGGGGGGGGGGDTASSDRANSADSSRSQPPSRRTSRLGSLEFATSSQEDESAAPTTSTGIVNGARRQVQGSSSTTGAKRDVDVVVVDQGEDNSKSGDVMATRPANKAAGAPAQEAGRRLAAGLTKREASMGGPESSPSYSTGRAGNSNGVSNADLPPERPTGGRPIGGVVGAGVARIFSKVDEELSRLTGGSNAKQQQQNVTEANNNVASGGANNTRIEFDTGEPVVSDNQLFSNDSRPQQQGLQAIGQGDADDTVKAADGADGTDGTQDDDGDGAATMSPRKRSRKNWFMNVYSNFVRMLNGLRTTISDVGQLEVGENDYQDKQLEILAGKIDNWYSGQPSPSSNDTTTAVEQQQPQQQQQQQQQQRQRQPTPSEPVVVVSNSRGEDEEAKLTADGPDSINISSSSTGARIAPEVSATATETDASDNHQQQQQQRAQAPSNSSSALDRPRLVGDSAEQVAVNLASGTGRDDTTTTTKTMTTTSSDQTGPEMTIGKAMIAERAPPLLSSSPPSQSPSPSPSSSQASSSSNKTSTATIQRVQVATTKPSREVIENANVGVSSGEPNENVPDTTPETAASGSDSLKRNKSLDTLDEEESNATISEPTKANTTKTTATATTCRSDTSRSDGAASANEAELGPEDLQAEANCKASALERIEAALNNNNNNNNNGTVTAGELDKCQTSVGTLDGGGGGGETIPAGPDNGDGDDEDDNDDKPHSAGTSADYAENKHNGQSGPNRKRAGKPVMINSSTSIDSVINLAAMSALDVSGKISSGGFGPNQSAAAASLGQPTTMAGDQIDESSGGPNPLKQSNRWPPDRVAGGGGDGQPPMDGPNGLTFDDGRRESIDGVSVESGHPTMTTTATSNTTTTTTTNNGNLDSRLAHEKRATTQRGQQPLMETNATITNEETTTTTTTRGASGGKDERRDGGVKLDSRNGISHGELLAADGGPTNVASPGQRENGPTAGSNTTSKVTTSTPAPTTTTTINIQTSANRNDNDNTVNGRSGQLNKSPISLAQSSGRNSSPKSTQQQQQLLLKKQIKGIPPVTNGTSTTNATSFTSNGGQAINGNRAKLLSNDGKPNYNTNSTGNGNGNNILNGKIMFQQSRLAYSDRNGITTPSNQMATANEVGNRLQPAGA